MQHPRRRWEESAPLAASSSAREGTDDWEEEDFWEEEDMAEPVWLLGLDITHCSRAMQFTVCAVCLFFFALLYGYLQELVSVQLCSRQLALFLATLLFTGYTVGAYLIRGWVDARQQKKKRLEQKQPEPLLVNNEQRRWEAQESVPPLALYLGLSFLRATDLATTNWAMQYVNFPARTLMESSRVVVTMIFGVVIQRKVYAPADYLLVVAMVLGLATFLHADATRSAVFHSTGVILLTVALVCDGVLGNVSESMMHQYGVGPDEFIFRLSSISLLVLAFAAAVNGDFYAGVVWMCQPGTYQQFLDHAPMEERTWSVPGKCLTMILLSSTGFLASSCSTAITKHFGALAMTITSTARKATTLFLSFLLFHNVCTTEHVAGIALFITALTAKSVRGQRHHTDTTKERRRRRAAPMMHTEWPVTTPTTTSTHIPASWQQ